MFQTKGKPFISMPVIYRSVEQVLATLTRPDIGELPEVKRILRIGVESQVFQEINGKLEPFPVQKLNLQRKDASPFIVIEGLDGCGKTTLTKYLQKALKMKLLSTPPPCLKEGNLRSFMDAQNPSIRRAYYSLGNYVAAKEVLQSEFPVVMDRFWHSTAAYAVATLTKNTNSGDGASSNVLSEDLYWPSDLLKPNLVIFLTVSEKERLRRHRTRKDFTNTVEEQTLAADAEFRQSLGNYYRSIKGVPFQEVSVDGTLEESKSNVFNSVLASFPWLKE